MGRILLELGLASSATESHEAVANNDLDRLTHRAERPLGDNASIQRIAITLLRDDRSVDLLEIRRRVFVEHFDTACATKAHETILVDIIHRDVFAVFNQRVAADDAGIEGIVVNLCLDKLFVDFPETRLLVGLELANAAVTAETNLTAVVFLDDRVAYRPQHFAGDGASRERIEIALGLVVGLGLLLVVLVGCYTLLERSQNELVLAAVVPRGETRITTPAAEANRFTFIGQECLAIDGLAADGAGRVDRVLGRCGCCRRLGRGGHSKAADPDHGEDGKERVSSGNHVRSPMDCGSGMVAPPSPKPAPSRKEST